MTLECIDEWRGIGPCDQSSVYGSSVTVVFGSKQSCFYEGRPRSLYTCVRVVVHRRIFHRENAVVILRSRSPSCRIGTARWSIGSLLPGRRRWRRACTRRVLTSRPCRHSTAMDITKSAQIDDRRRYVEDRGDGADGPLASRTHRRSRVMVAAQLVPQREWLVGWLSANVAQVCAHERAVLTSRHLRSHRDLLR